MWKPALAMLTGVLAVLALPQLLPGPWLAAALPVAALGLAWKRTRWLVFLPLGFVWCWQTAGRNLDARLDPALEGRELTAVGWVHSLPETRGPLVELHFAVETLDGKPPGPGTPKLIRLSLADADPVPQAGEHWRFQVRLRRPRGFMNPGGFDYEGWLFRRAIGATGYVLEDAVLLPGGLRYPLLRLRASLRQRIGAALPADAFAGMAAALATGDQGGISEDQWQVLQATNTVHLMAIAGLHIGVVAGFLFLLLRAVWRRSAWLCARWPAQVGGAVAAFLGAAVYAALAGFTLPTQRALIMLAAFALGVVLRRRLKPADTLGLALLGVLLLDPLAASEASFWLSFGAVAAILFVYSGRVGLRHTWLMELLRTQWAVGIGLLPLLAFFFQRAGMTAPLANLAVVPLYSLLVVPLTLCGAILLSFWPAAGALLLKGATGVMALSWPFLERLAHLPSASLPAPAPALIPVTLAMLGAFWLLMPRGMPARLPAALLLLPLFITPPTGIPPGGFDVTLLDVGQGLSAVVRTADHVLVFDTGPRFLSGSDTGSEVLIPYLQSQGITAPDLTVLSHGDSDHSGGLASLRNAYPSMPVYTSAVDRFPRTRACLQGQRWEWDGVRFAVLYPDQDTPYSGNDASCVLKVSGPGGSVLLTGDLMKKGEKRLLQLDAGGLKSELLVAPHHGSNSSSTPPFVAAVAPAAVWFPVGYRNRWDFPKPEVVDRYRQTGAELADSASDGALRMCFRPGSQPVLNMRWRRDAAHLWTAQ
ncbi:MAG TPA: DNA internalization-related competence protein ComEC/Rec2 [Gammaproteobacteria bacterium]|nr:DNA internalization-related competence protein ComEC/Rec2 [Gammaproteobacteria bacterium]